MIVQIGNVQFSTDFGYETLQRIRKFNWGSVDIIGDHPALQFVGKSMELNLNGVRFEYGLFGDDVSSLEELADAAEPVGITDDQGSFYGYWVILEISRSEDSFRPRQKTGIRTTWNLKLQFYSSSIDASTRQQSLINQSVRNVQRNIQSRISRFVAGIF